MDEKRLTWLLRRSDCTTALSSWDFSPCLCGLSVYESFATCALSSLNWVSRMPFQSWIVETIIGEMRLYRRLNFSQLFCFTNGCCSPRVSRSYYWRDENLQTSNIPWHEWSSHSMDRARFRLVECLAEEVKLDPSKTSLLTQLKRVNAGLIEDVKLLGRLKFSQLVLSLEQWKGTGVWRAQST